MTLIVTKPYFLIVLSFPFEKSIINQCFIRKKSIDRIRKDPEMKINTLKHSTILIKSILKKKRTLKF